MSHDDKRLASMIRACDPFQRANTMQRAHRYSGPVAPLAPRGWRTVAA